jgi:hypothetical protein
VFNSFCSRAIARLRKIKRAVERLLVPGNVNSSPFFVGRMIKKVSATP